MYFLGTNYRTAQGYHGDVIVDECFWIYGFEELFKVASAMATQKQYTITLFSTPSTLAHEAYPMWNGDRYNKRRAKADRVKLDISHAALCKGMLGADKVWRQIVTIDDAIAGGFDLVDAEHLQFQYSPEEYDNLSRQAVATVRAAMAFAGKRKYLFPSIVHSHRPITDSTLSKGYRLVKGHEGKQVPHGWRASFSTIMNERALDAGQIGDRQIIDLMLAHVPAGVEARYNRAAYMPRRRQIAQEWADLLCEGLASVESLLELPRH